MNNKYDDFDLELSTSMLDDIDNGNIEENKEDTPPIDDNIKTVKQKPRNIKIIVFIGIIILLIIVVIVRLLGYYTSSRNKPIVDAKPKQETVVSSGDVADKKNEAFNISGLKDNRPKPKEENGVGLVPNTSESEVNNSFSNSSGKYGDNQFSFNDGDGVKNNPLDPTSNVVDSETTHTTSEPQKPEVILPTKKQLSIIVGSVSNTNGNTSTQTLNKNPGDVVKNEPKVEKDRDEYYTKHLGQGDLINAYNMGISNEEYYKRYVAGQGKVESNTSDTTMTQVKHWKDRQIGIKATESFDEYDLKEGSYIPVTIATNIRSDRPGTFQAIVREDVYDSLNHRYTLIPKGSRIIGNYGALANNNAKHLDMVVTRIIFPNGKSLQLGSMNITDLQGTKGGTGYKDERYGERLLKSGFTLAVGLVSDFVGNTSIGTNGFSIGKKHFDYHLNKLTPPKETDKAVDPGSNPNVTRTRVTNGYGLTVSEARSIMSTLNSIPLSNEFKNDLNAGYYRVVNENRNAQENVLGYLLAKYISDKLGNAIYGNSDNPNNTTNPNNGGISNTSGAYNNPSTPSTSNDSNILSSLLGLGGNSGLGNIIPGLSGGTDPLSSLLGTQGGGLAGLDKLKALISESNIDKEREQLGTNNIVKDVKTTLGNVRNAWNSVTPVIHIQGGARLNLYVSKDISLEPYVERVNRK